MWNASESGGMWNMALRGECVEYGCECGGVWNVADSGLEGSEKMPPTF